VRLAREMLPEEWRVPRGPRRSRKLLTQRAHRVQVALARRRGANDGQQSGIRIICYHRIADDQDRLAVAPSAFRAQMEAILALHVEPIGLPEVLPLFAAQAVGRYICVTFDDGYRDNLENAVPVLRELGIPATIFIPTAAVDGTAHLYWYETQPPLLDWADLAQLSKDGLISIGAHSRRHPALPSLPDDVAWSEIAGSKQDLEEHLGRESISFAYPAGMFNERDLRMVREAGYRMAVTTEPGLNGPRQSPHALRRTVIDQQDDLNMFEGKVTGLLDHPWGVDKVRTLLRGSRWRRT
jgi:peptidoglycan/xylan/chitin deacetylase (PgdA/CDA1 family)